MSPDVVPLSALSFSKDGGNIPVVERTLLTFDEAVEYQVVSDLIRVAGMAMFIAVRSGRWNGVGALKEEGFP